jgi:negative regulator of flagellin synthesis FlgM
MDISKIQDKNQIADAKLRSSQDVKNAAGAKTREVDSQEIKSAEKAAGTEKVTWSTEASLMREAMDSVRGAPDVRSEKVAALKDAIRSGSYRVDAGKIADRMIQGSLEDDLISRKS